MPRCAKSVVIDNAGNLFIADINNSRVRKVDGVTGLISTYAGTDRCCNSADGVAAVDSNVRPFALALDGQNNLLIADNNRVRRVDGDSGIIVTVAGNGQWGYGGDGGGALDARFSTIRGLAIDSSGNIFIADHGNHRVRKIDSATGVITTLAGNGRCDAFVEGSQATNASICGPAGLSLRGKDLLIASEWGNRIHRVDLVTGTMTTVAGSGGWGFAGDGASALEANFRHPTDVQVDAQGNLFIVDRANQRIRRVDGSTGIISSVAGIGTPGFAGDGGPAIKAMLDEPIAAALDNSGNLYFADLENRRIRVVHCAASAAPGAQSDCSQGSGTVFAGQRVRVSWNVLGATSCVASGSWSGVKARKRNGLRRSASPSQLERTRRDVVRRERLVVWSESIERL